MKTKNILLPAIALAIFATPTIAQIYGTPTTVKGANSSLLYQFPSVSQASDSTNLYNDQEAQTIRENVHSFIKKDINQLSSKQEYLNIALLRSQLNENLEIDLEHLKTITENSLAENKISLLEQYSVMQLCIMTNHNDVLATLIEAGFNPTLDRQLGITSLAAKAVQYNNVEAFGLTFSFYNKERTLQVLEDLDKIDHSLVNRFFEFVNKCKPMETSQKAANVKISKTPKEQESVTTTGIMSAPDHGSKYNKNASVKEGYVVDTVPSATATIKVVSDTVPNK